MTKVILRKTQANKPKGKTNWKRLEKQTDAQIERAARADITAPLVSDYDANQFKSAKELRDKLPT